jgi:tRNA (cmo5U34)-methyltransferase
MTEIAKSYNDQAQAYDDFIRKLVPDYEVFHELLTKHLGQVASVFDVGCGTGNTSLRLLENNPDIKLTCLDTSAQMLESAKSKLGDQHVFTESPIENYEPSDNFDAVVSVMVMHNIQTISDRLKTYQKIAGALSSGGTYLAVDIFQGETDQLQKVYMAQWRDFMLKNLPENEVDGKWIKLHKEKDKPLKLLEQIRLLQEAGFSTVDVVHKRLQFAMLIAQK